MVNIFIFCDYYALMYQYFNQNFLSLLALEFTGGVPYDILKPILERATADQLFMLEHYNPYLIEDTDILWQYHCNREFRNKDRQEMESWREMYMVGCKLKR